MIVRSLHSSPMARSSSQAFFTHSSIRTRWTIGIHLVVWMTLRAMGSVVISVPLISGFHTCLANTMSRIWISVGIFLSVSMPSRAMGDIRFPAISIANFVLTIFARRSPIEIFKEIVIRIIVSMECPLTGGSRTDESFEDEDMDRSLVLLAVTGEATCPVTAISSSSFRSDHNLALESLRGVPTTQNFTIKGTHAAMAGDFISQEIGDRQPQFFTGHKVSVPYAYLVDPISPKTLERQGD
jgi:hypothetical protein